VCIKIVRGAECEVQCPVQSAEIGVRLLRHRFFFGSAVALPSRKLFANRYSLFAVVFVTVYGRTGGL
jgi:hypothetical protein